jgi:hypothetical protein
MTCGVCNKDMASCTCPDLRKRLEDILKIPYLHMGDDYVRRIREQAVRNEGIIPDLRCMKIEPSVKLGECDKMPSAKRGMAVWIENGVYYTNRKVNPKKFGGHEYDNGGYEKGIRECKCGCRMYDCESSGPVDPFGACPKNPLP